MILTGEELRARRVEEHGDGKITYHPQSGWFEDTPLKGVHEGTFLTEAGHPTWNHS